MASSPPSAIKCCPLTTKFMNFVHQEFEPKAAPTSASGRWPNGTERYAYAIRVMTTTNMKPEEIHQSFARSRAHRSRGTRHRQETRLNDLKSFKTRSIKIQKCIRKSREQILDEYRHYTDQMWQQLPKLFGRLPKAKLEVLPVEPFREKEASTEYKQGTPDGSRPATSSSTPTTTRTN